MRLITSENIVNTLFAKIQSNAIANGGCHWDGYKNWCIRGTEIEQALGDIFAEDDLFKPTIDIVQCKDCKYYRESQHPERKGIKFCYRLKDSNGEHIGYNCADDDFCSHGEKKEEAEPQQDCTYNKDGHCMGQKMMPECDQKSCDRKKH